MEQLQECVRQLTGAVNAQIELVKTIDRRLTALETEKRPTESERIVLQPPQNEEDLREISKLPDCVKELQVFDGNPVQYISWIHSVENILKDYDVARKKPIYRAILQSIRNKIRGAADAALISYNIFDDDWQSIKKCLSLHYADKRDLHTLEHQLNFLIQGKMTLDEFYAQVNHQFSLIVNKVKTEDYSHETMNALINTYRNRALDVFIRGVNGEMSRMMTIRRPETLPEAYSLCLEIQNLNFRNLAIQRRDLHNSIVTPINQIFPRSAGHYNSGHPPKPAPRTSTKPLPISQRNEAYNIQHRQSPQPPPRPSQAKPPVPMEVDESIQTKRVNYMNRPAENPVGKRNYSSDNYPYKQQRVYNLETTNNYSAEDDIQLCKDELEEDSTEYDDEETEVNFMTQASLAYHT